MTLKNKLERVITDLQTEIVALRQSIKGLDREIKSGAVYKPSELAALVDRSDVTIYRAIQAGFLKSSGGRILGRDALAWVEAGLPTGKNKSHVQINRPA